MNRDARHIAAQTLASCAVLDVDLSQWEHRFRLVVAADIATYDSTPQLCDIYSVDFTQMRSMSWGWPKWSQDAPSEHEDRLSQEGHARWYLWKCTINQLHLAYSIELSGSGPSLTIECGDVEVSREELRNIELLNPHWFTAGARFIRGTVEQIADLVQGKHQKHRSDKR